MTSVCPASSGEQAITRVGRQAYAAVGKHAVTCQYEPVQCGTNHYGTKSRDGS